MSLQLRFIFQQLSADSRVSGIVGDRIYPIGEVPDRVMPPYVTFQRISSTHERNLSAGEGIGRTRWQVNCWGRSAKESESIFDGVRQSLDNFRDVVDIGGVDLDVRRVMLEDSESSYEPPFDGSDRAVHVTRCDLMVWARETITP